jgi:hypothetical protein
MKSTIQCLSNGECAYIFSFAATNFVSARRYD